MPEITQIFGVNGSRTKNSQFTYLAHETDHIVLDQKLVSSMQIFPQSLSTLHQVFARELAQRVHHYLENILQ